MKTDTDCVLIIENKYYSTNEHTISSIKRSQAINQDRELKKFFFGSLAHNLDFRVNVPLCKSVRLSFRPIQYKNFRL